jgi:hypothetical protein
VYITNKESVKKPMGTKSFVQIEINAIFTSTSGKMQFRSGVFDHFKGPHEVLVVSVKCEQPAAI